MAGFSFEKAAKLWGFDQNPSVGSRIMLDWRVSMLHLCTAHLWCKSATGAKRITRWGTFSTNHVTVPNQYEAGLGGRFASAKRISDVSVLNGQLVALFSKFRPPPRTLNYQKFDLINVYMNSPCHGWILLWKSCKAIGGFIQNDQQTLELCSIEGCQNYICVTVGFGAKLQLAQRELLVEVPSLRLTLAA